MRTLGHMLATMRNRTGASTAGARDHNHHTMHQWCVPNYYYFYIPIWAEDAVNLSSKVSDENGRENQTKRRWVWSRRHNENGMRCGKRKLWEKVLRWGKKFPRLLFHVMKLVKLAGVIVTLRGCWGVQVPWDLLLFKLYISSSEAVIYSALMFQVKKFVSG